METKKISRKQLLKEPDEFISLSTRAVNYITANPKKVTNLSIAVLGVLVLAVVGFFFFKHQAQSNRLEFNQVLGQANAEEDTNKKIEILKGYLDTHSGSERGALVAAELGGAYFKAGNYESAAVTLERALKGLESYPKSRIAVRLALAQSYEALNQYAQGVELLLKNEKEQGDFLKEENTLVLARLYRGAGDVEKARAMYEAFLKTYPQSASKELAESLLRQLGTEGGGPAPSTSTPG
ncbi:MAG: tetratricopeptide repeat protein [Deltaproteobacteria bacterium]|nr:tetratricopeptide repeat protein [Deltaproteobacteria bacterium]